MRAVRLPLGGGRHGSILRRWAATLPGSTQPEPLIDPHGILTRRLVWPEAVEIVKTRSFNRFGRLPADQALYHRRMREMKEEFASVGDYVLHHKFGYQFQQQANSQGGKKFVEPPQADIEANRYVWLLNDFPYALTDGIIHYLIWSLRPFDQASCSSTNNEEAGWKGKVEAIIARHIDIEATDYVFFVNPPALRSVPTVSHVHVLTHPRDFPR